MRTLQTFAAVLLLVSCQRVTNSTTVPPQASAIDLSEIDKVLASNLAVAYNGGVYVEVAQNGKKLYSSGLGGKTANSTALIASGSKSFAALVVLALVDDGLLKLDDPIGKYLPVFNQYNKGTPTIRQCFSHTSGFIGSEDEDVLSDRTITLEEAANIIAKDIPLAYKPGSSFAYGGVSMHIIGRVAEVVSKKSWNQLFKEKVIDKLDLQSSSFLLYASNPRISGGMVSSATDLMKVCSMILNKGLYNGTRVLSEAACAELWKDQTAGAAIVSTPYIPTTTNNPYNAKEVRYSVGCWLDVQNPTTKNVEQISGAGAFGCRFWIDRCRNITGVVFTSSNYTQANAANSQIIDIVRKKTGGSCN
jgi:CubicO group peptidase (beta-lactamase class C family)